MIVFSFKRAYSSNLLKNALSLLRWFFQKKYKEMKFRRTLKMNLLFVGDVNSPYFYNRISKTDVGIVAGFNQIFRNKIILRFKFLVNFHPSILLLYRGPVPSYWCIKNEIYFTHGYRKN